MRFSTNIASVILFTCLFVACNQGQKDREHIADLQLQVDSIFSSTQVLSKEQKATTQQLIDAYLEYAESNAKDESAAAYMFEAARLKTALPDYKGAIDIFQLVVNKFPKSNFAPRSLLSIGGIYDVTMSDPETARGFYETLLKDYPLQAEEYGVPAILRTLGQSPEQILQDLLNKQGNGQDTVDISTGLSTQDK